MVEMRRIQFIALFIALIFDHFCQAAEFITYHSDSDIVFNQIKDIELDPYGQVLIASQGLLERFDEATGQFVPIAGTGVRSGLMEEGNPLDTTFDVLDITVSLSGAIYALEWRGRIARIIEGLILNSLNSSIPSPIKERLSSQIFFPISRCKMMIL